ACPSSSALRIRCTNAGSETIMDCAESTSAAASGALAARSSRSRPTAARAASARDSPAVVSGGGVSFSGSVGGGASRATVPAAAPVPAPIPVSAMFFSCQTSPVRSRLDSVLGIVIGGDELGELAQRFVGLGNVVGVQHHLVTALCVESDHGEDAARVDGFAAVLADGDRHGLI